jgi:hypothetical protein
MNSRKNNARQNAAEKITRRDHLPEQPELPRSVRKISQERFTGETPLTGEDRPVDKAQGKQQGFVGAAAKASAGPISGRKPASPTRPYDRLPDRS